MLKTAVATVAQMNLPEHLKDALKLDRHPQDRTEAFHQTFDAPIHNKLPDKTFSHMDDQRVAFRAAFIISEIFELLEKGLGLDVWIDVDGGNPNEAPYRAVGSDNAQLTTAILNAMRDRGSEARDVVEVVDALGDLNVVVNGFALELGADMSAIDQEVLASNLTKLGEDGAPIVADGSDPKYPAGKILKGPNFMEPQIAYLLGLEE